MITKTEDIKFDIERLEARLDSDYYNHDLRLPQATLASGFLLALKRSNPCFHKLGMRIKFVPLVGNQLKEMLDRLLRIV